MKCPNLECGYPRMVVIDTRYSDGIPRRRRECPKCKTRLTTYELAVDDKFINDQVGHIKAQEQLQDIVG